VYRAIAANKRNTVLIIGLFVLLVAAIGYVANLIYAPGDYTITIATVIGVGVYTLIQYFFASRQAVAMSGAQPISRADDPRLFRIVENLAITEGMPMPAVYVIDDPAPNAFATGRDPQHAIVAATTGLLAIMDDSELEGVMAHELGHVKNYDIRVTTIVFGLVVAVGFLADVLLRMTFFSRGNRNQNPVVLIAGLVALVLAPLVAGVVQAAVSRQREYLADATGALTTRYPEGLARALAKLGAYGRPMQRQNSTMAHMWISDPTRPGVIDRLFSTHPPLEARIARLRESGGGF